ncbi:MAG: AmmeMemoRadiSam system protein B, partial [Candidatus Omnitrophota bacterium]|nr:AmmeMemoRadiSam system protein B [Candidatus Omnitrophota bacterium]
LSFLMFTLLACTGVSAETRPAQVAGQFYPEEQAELLDLVSELLQRQPDPDIADKPRILIVPHAGYQYSGLIAANAYRHLKGHAYDGVVVVGFTHRLQFQGSSVDTAKVYETPLGELPVHQEAVAVLGSYPGIVHEEAAHASAEHSLEVQLPFLQMSLDRFRLVPVLMGGARLEDAEQLAEALAGLSRLGDYLFVFSTDLSHYHPYDEAVRRDEDTVNAIVFETPQAVHQLFGRGALEACGRGPIVTSLLLAATLGYPSRELLYYANSGDTAGQPTSVVGYAAIGMFDRPKAVAGRLSAEAGGALVKAVRATLERSLALKEILPVDLSYYRELTQAHGVFVTLRRAGQLRGCIGRIETDEPLAKTVPIVAMEAALHDTRFAPVSAEELDDIDVEVSVLTPPVKVESPREVVAGRDGVVIEHQGHRGVFLPQVWEETGWTRVEFLQQLASQKAGLPPDAWQQATLYVFQDQIFEEELLPLPLPEAPIAH